MGREIRVGELVRLNIDDIDFSKRECVVYGRVVWNCVLGKWVRSWA